MLKKLSQRERIMAIAVAALLPIALVMFLLIYVGGKLADRSDRISALNDEQNQLQLRMAVGRRAVARGETYRQESLPSDANKSELEYSAWFADLCEQTLGKQNLNVAMGYPQTVKFGMSEVVFHRQSFSISGECTLPQLTKFLYRFYQTKILHRLSILSLIPHTEGTGSRVRLTGRLRFNMSFDVVAVANADPDRDFSNEQREMLRPLEDYLDVVARRNLFGPPNTPPKLATSDKLEFDTGNDISINLTASDGDEDQDLTIELVEKSAAEARLVQSDNTSAVISVPALPKGQHKLLARATDNGWPRKSHDLELIVVVDDPAPQVISGPEPPPIYARYAFVSGITSNIAGNPVVWIRVPQPADQLHQLTVGESFELDELVWTIVEISGNKVIIDVNGENRTYRVRSTLDDSERPSVSAAAAAAGK